MNKRNLFILTILVFISSYGKAQMYTIDYIYLPASSMEVGFYTDADKPKYIYYDIKNDDSHEKALARIPLSNIKSFITSLQKAKVKYEEWSKVVEEEGSRIFTKNIPKLFIKDQTVFFTDGGKWYRENGVDMKGVFSVNNLGECFLVLQSDNMQSEELVGESSMLGGSYTSKFNVGSIFGSSSQVTIKHYCSGASLTFRSSNEIDAFIEKLKNVLDWKNKQNSRNKKFK